jgi:hypothetical protein
MALKYKFKDVKEIPVGDERHYVERDGEWVLDAEGLVEKAKLDEFRTSNVTLKKELEEFKARYDGIDPEEVKRLADEKRKLELQAQGHKPEEIEKIVVDRVKGIKADFDKQLGSLTTERDTLTSRLPLDSDSVLINRRRFTHGAAPVASIEVWRRVDIEPEELIATVPSSQVSFYDSTAVRGETELTYKVRYRNGDTFGPFSNEYLINVSL